MKFSVCCLYILASLFTASLATAKSTETDETISKQYTSYSEDCAIKGELRGGRGQGSGRGVGRGSGGSPGTGGPG